jgi:membrane protein
MMAVTSSPAAPKAPRSPRLAALPERFVLRLLAHNAFETAAAVAFWFFLSLVPLLVLVGYFVGQVARTRGVDDLVGPLLEVVPGSAEGLIRSELERLAGARGASVAPLGVVGFLWTASSGLHNLMDVCESVVSVKRRPWWKQRLIALGWVVVGLATACLLAWLVVSSDTPAHGRDAPSAAPSVSSTSPSPPARSASSADRGAKGPPPAAASARGRAPSAPSAPKVRALPGARTQVLAAGLLLVSGMLLLGGFYRFAVEHPPGVKRRVWPGAAAAIASWLSVSWAFGAYVVSINNYALYYGSLAAVAVLLIWLYLTSLALVLGCEVNAELEGAQ